MPQKLTSEQLEKLCPGITQPYDDTEMPVLTCRQGTQQSIAVRFESREQITELITQLQLLLKSDRPDFDLGLALNAELTTMGELGPLTEEELAYEKMGHAGLVA